MSAAAGPAAAQASFRLTVAAAPPELRLAVSPELVIHQGGGNRLQVRVARGSLLTLVQVRVEGDVRGIQPGEFTLAAAENEAAVEFKADAGAAKKFLAVGDAKLDEALDPAEAAAWASVGNALLNLDATIYR